MRNKALYLALRIAARLVPLVPLNWAYRIADLVGSLAYLLVPAARRSILSNLAVALPECDATHLHSIARHALQHDARNWIDTLRITDVDQAKLAESVDVAGWEHLDRAVALGRGVIIVTFHLGNFDLVGQLIVAHGLKITVPVERVQPERLFEFLRRRRASRGIDIVPLEKAPRAMLAAIRRGELVGVAADRLISGKSTTVDFFGRPTQFPRGPASLAWHTGAPVLLGVGLRQSGNRYRGLLSAPIEVPRSSDQASDEQRLLQSLAYLMEPLIRETPSQWLAFSPIWSDQGSGNTPATMGEQREVAV